MFRIPGQPGKDVCDSQVLPSRRDILRVGGAGMLGLSLGSMLELQALANTGVNIEAMYLLHSDSDGLHFAVAVDDSDSARKQLAS